MNETKNITFRPLRADEVECRVGNITANGCSLLLYKTARTDMDLLDEVMGPENWQNEFYELGDKLFCRLGLRINGEWIWKSDCGIEGNAGEEKSQASDARKRAGFAWGIGRELYRAPFIFLNVPTERRNDGRGYQLKEFPKYDVKVFEATKTEVKDLVIVDKHGNEVFRMGAPLKEARKTSKPSGQAAAPAAPTTPAPHIMTKEEFRARWNQDDQGGGITFDDIADCAKAWGICSKPKIRPIEEIRDKVLEAAGCSMPTELEIAISDLKKARNRAELQQVHNQYKAVYGEYGSARNEQYCAVLNEMSRKYPRPS
jgi:hypothetical protein